MGVPFGFEIDDSGEFLVVVKPGIFRQNQSVHNMISYVRYKIVFEYLLQLNTALRMSGRIIVQRFAT